MNRIHLPAALTLFLSVLPGCGPPPKGPWITKLSALPPPVRQGLFESFRPSAAFLREHPDYRERKEEEIITDVPGKFGGGCSIPEGFAGKLFLRAKEAAGSWVVEYKYGGVAHGTDVLVLSPDKTGVFRLQPPPATAAPNAETVVLQILGRG